MGQSRANAYGRVAGFRRGCGEPRRQASLSGTPPRASIGDHVILILTALSWGASGSAAVLILLPWRLLRNNGAFPGYYSVANSPPALPPRVVERRSWNS